MQAMYIRQLPPLRLPAARSYLFPTFSLQFYTIPLNERKYQFVYELIHDHFQHKSLEKK